MTNLLRHVDRPLKGALSALALAGLLLAGVSPDCAAESLPSCTAQQSSDLTNGFDAANFNVTNVASDADGAFSLATGFQAINPQQIVVPFEQNVSACFLYENAGYTSTLGWMLKSDAVDPVTGSFLGWRNIADAKKHALFSKVADGTNGGDGILDSVAGRSEAQLTAAGYLVDGNGTAGPADMCRPLGRFAAGTELVFWLANDTGDWTPAGTYENKILYTKSAWNPDTFTSCLGPNGTTHQRSYRFGQEQTGNGCTLLDKGLFELNTITRLSGLNLSFRPPPNDVRSMSVTYGQKFAHALLAAPQQDPNQWVLAWEDFSGGGDMDYNDILFRIRRETGGALAMKPAAAVRPADPEAFYTSVTIGVYDDIPGGSCNGKVGIDYFVSIDNGVNWVEILATGWDSAQEYTVDANGNKILVGNVLNGAVWTPGTPARTYRTRRIDFAGSNLVGRELVWKAFLKSDDEACVPRVAGATLSGNTRSHDVISRTSPIKLANLLYTGSYETPAIDWADKTLLRGHVKATRLYLPEYPDVADTPLHLEPVNITVWDAGAQLQSVLPENRTVYFPDITQHAVALEALSLTTPAGQVVSSADGVTASFKGRLANAPLVATSVRIAAGPLNGTMVFDDTKGTDLLSSDAGHGTINRFTGEFELFFDAANIPAAGVAFQAAYQWYSTSSQPRAFTAANVTNGMLALTAETLVPSGYKYDLDGNGQFTEQDGDWLVDWVRGYKDGRFRTAQKSWKLGPIDHSVPAVMTPPGVPEWYFGTAIPDEMRQSYMAFKDAQKNRDTVLFVGSRDGLLHAFDAGKFRFGDNPRTSTVKEEEGRGYFLWENVGVNVVNMQPNYGTGRELWGFIPANLMPRLKYNLLQGDDQAYIDASPTLVQALIGTEWRTLLLSAQGNGGDSIFCLDVTDPASPKFLWEFADPDLFRSRSSPAVGQIGLLLINGQPKWVAFFVSGKSDAALYPSVYAIDITNGSVIKRIFLDSDASALGGVPSGQPAIVDTDDNGYIDRLYVTSVAKVSEGGVTREKGFLHKVNLPDDPVYYWRDATINNVVINGDFIDDDGATDEFGNPAPRPVPSDWRWHPIYASPTVVVDDVYDPTDNSRERLIRLFFGTGDSPYFDENINEGNTRYHFFAYIDRAPKVSTFPDLSDDPDAVELDWFYELPAGQRIFATAFASAGKVYFGTSSSETENPCEGSNQGEFFAFNLTGYRLAPPAPAMRHASGDVLSSPLVDDRQAFIISTTIKKVGDDKYNTPQQNKGFGEAKPSSWREVLN